MKVMVAYDGTLQAKEALRFGSDKARETGAMLAVLQVVDSGMFAGYESSPGARDTIRREAAMRLGEAKAIVKAAGVDAYFFTAEGDPEETVVEFATSEKVDFIVCAPRLRSLITRREKAADKGSALLLDFTGKTTAVKAA